MVTMEDIAACARQLDALADEYQGNPKGDDAVSVFLRNHNVEGSGAMYVAVNRTLLVARLRLPRTVAGGACWLDGFSIGVMVGRDTR